MGKNDDIKENAALNGVKSAKQETKSFKFRKSSVCTHLEIR